MAGRIELVALAKRDLKSIALTNYATGAWSFCTNSLSEAAAVAQGGRPLRALALRCCCGHLRRCCGCRRLRGSSPPSPLPPDAMRCSCSMS